MRIKRCEGLSVHFLLHCIGMRSHWDSLQLHLLGFATSRDPAFLIGVIEGAVVTPHTVVGVGSDVELYFVTWHGLVPEWMIHFLEPRVAILAGLHILTRLPLWALLREVPDPVRHASEVFWFVIIYAFLIIMGDCQIRTLLSFETKGVVGATT